MSDSEHNPKDDYDDRPPGPAGQPLKLRRTWRFRPNPWKWGVGLGIGLSLLIAAAFGLYRETEKTDRRNKLIGLKYAIQSFDAAYGKLPHNTYAADGRPLLSWRVHLLPFLEEDLLYRRFQLDEPWDSSANLALLKEMPRAYAPPRTSPKDCRFLTHYRGFSSPGAMFERRPGDHPTERLRVFGVTVAPRARFRLTSIRDERASTILLVEAWDPVEWTKPDDLDASPGKPFPRMGGFSSKSMFYALMADGLVRPIPLDTPDDKLRAMITHSGGETVTLD